MGSAAAWHCFLLFACTSPSYSPFTPRSFSNRLWLYFPFVLQVLHLSSVVWSGDGESTTSMAPHRIMRGSVCIRKGVLHSVFSAVVVLMMFFGTVSLKYPHTTQTNAERLRNLVKVTWPLKDKKLRPEEVWWRAESLSTPYGEVLTRKPSVHEHIWLSHLSSNHVWSLCWPAETLWRYFSFHHNLSLKYLSFEVIL